MTLIGDVSAKIIITTLLSLLESALCQVWIFFFIYVLANLDMAHPGSKDDLKHVGISVRRNAFGLC